MEGERDPAAPRTYNAAMGIELIVVAVPDETLERLDEGSSEEVVASVMFQEDHPYCNVGRCWHVLHYLLTGSGKAGKGPLTFIWGGGRAVGPDGEYDIARAFDSEKCAAIAAALPAADVLRKRFAAGPIPEKIVQGDRINRDGIDEYLVPIYEELAGFVREAAERGDGLLLQVIG